MKKLISLLILIFSVYGTSYSQLPDILKKIPGVSDIVLDEAVSTSIKDAYPTAFWLKDLDKRMNKVTDQSFTPDLEPGYYKFDFKTYCLHAGTYEPTQGMGYLLAPLKGSKAGLIKSILTKYGEHPEIDQKDVQMLIWGIEANAKFSSYDPDFQVRVTPLLTPSEIALMEVDIKKYAMDLLPQQAQDVLNLYKEMRDKISNPASSYEDLERLAVKTGIPPIGPGSKNIDAGTWSSAGNGVYLRCFPHGYRQSDVEVYIPEQVTINRDEQNRIISLDDGTYRIEFQYEDAAGSNLLNSELPICRFKSVQLTGENPDERMSVSDKGWYAPSKSKISSKVSYSREGDPTSSDYNEIKKTAESFSKTLKNSFSKRKGTRKFSDADINSLTELKELEISLSSLIDVNELSGNWYENNYNLVVNAVNRIIADHEAGISKGSNSSLSSMDIQGLVFAPANTSNQRLGTSGQNGNPGSNNNEGKKKKKNCNPDITLKGSIPTTCLSRLQFLMSILK